MKIGIIVAMQSELECVRCLLENPREEQHGSSLFIIGTNGKHELILTQSGIGKVSSAIRTYELIDRYAPDCILNTGVAGGIDRSMHVMDIVVGSEIVYHDVWCGTAISADKDEPDLVQHAARVFDARDEKTRNCCARGDVAFLPSFPDSPTAKYSFRKTGRTRERRHSARGCNRASLDEGKSCGRRAVRRTGNFLRRLPQHLRVSG